MDSPRITSTPIGQSYQWDHLCEVDFPMLRQNYIAKRGVLDNPAKFPNADFAAIRREMDEIEDFLMLYGTNAEIDIAAGVIA